MASSNPNMVLLLVSLASLVLLTSPANGQFPTPTPTPAATTSCSAATLAGLSPCMSFLTNNGSTPTADCCTSLQNITSTSTDCLCLVMTGAVPFQIPINRTLAISLPRACNMPGVPLQCKAAAGAPAPAPGSAAAAAPSLAPGVSPSDTPASSVVPETPSESGATAPALDTPTTTTGTTATTNTSAASYSFSPSFVLLVLGFVLFSFN